MVDIKTTVETIRGDVTFEEATGNTLYGVYEDIRFKIYHSPPETKEYDITRGNTTLSVSGPSDDPDSKGKINFYSERHNIEQSKSELHSLFKRARSIAKEISRNDSIYPCPYCGFMVHEDWKITRELLFNLRRTSTIITTAHTRGDSLCVGMQKWIPPVATLYEHRSTENLFFTDEELAECETLVRTTGYPPELENSRLDEISHLRLTRLVEEHPEVFDDDIDVETLKKVLRYRCARTC